MAQRRLDVEQRDAPHRLHHGQHRRALALRLALRLRPRLVGRKRRLATRRARASPPPPITLALALSLAALTVVCRQQVVGLNTELCHRIVH